MNQGTYSAIARDYMKATGKHFAGKSVREMRIEMQQMEQDLAPCTKCFGSGWVTASDQVECWGAMVTMESSEFCDRCIGENKCPACGQELTCPEDAKVITCACGYNSKTNCAEIEPETVGA